MDDIVTGYLYEKRPRPRVFFSVVFAIFILSLFWNVVEEFVFIFFQYSAEYNMIFRFVFWQTWYYVITNLKLKHTIFIL